MEIREMNVKWRIFAERMAEGMNATDAYLAAGYEPTQRHSAHTGASRLRMQPEVRAYLSELRQAADQIAREDTLFTVAAKLELLARIAQTSAATVREDDEIIQYHRSFKDGTSAVRLPCKLKAMKQHSELAGHVLPPPLPSLNPLFQLIHEVRGTAPSEAPKPKLPGAPRPSPPTLRKPKLTQQNLTSPSLPPAPKPQPEPVLPPPLPVATPPVPLTPADVRRMANAAASFAPQPRPYSGPMPGERTGVTIRR